MTIRKGRGPSRRTVLKSAAAAGAAATWPTALFAQSTRTLKLGLVTPRTGPLASFAEADGFVVDATKKLWANGLSIGGKTFPVEIIVKDSTSRIPNARRRGRGRSDPQGQDRLDAGVLDARDHQPGLRPMRARRSALHLDRRALAAVVLRARRQAGAKASTIPITSSGASRTSSHVFTDMWNSLPTNKLVGALFPNDGDGNAWGDKTLGFPPVLNKYGYKLTDPGRYQNMTADFSAQIQAFRDAKAEILTGVPIPPDFTTFWNQALQKGFKPKIASVGKALLFPASVEALGDNGNGLSTEVWWTPDLSLQIDIDGPKLSPSSPTPMRPQRKAMDPAHRLRPCPVRGRSRCAEAHQGPRPVRQRSATRSQRPTSTPLSARSSSARCRPSRTSPRRRSREGQWRPASGKYKYELVIVDNSQAPVVPVADKLKLIA